MRQLKQAVVVVSLCVGSIAVAGSPSQSTGAAPRGDASGTMSGSSYGGSGQAGTTGTSASPGQPTTMGGATTSQTGSAGQGQTGQMGQAGSMAAAQPMTEKDVVYMLHHVNKQEIDLGNIAKKMASSPRVKEYAARMVTDHTQAQKQVSDLAKKQKLSVRDTDVHAHIATRPEMKQQMEQDKQMMTRLQGMKGAEFDREYITMMATDHGKVAQKLEAAQGQLQGKPAGDLVTQLLPKIREHQTLATSIQQEVNMGRGGSGMGGSMGGSTGTGGNSAHSGSTGGSVHHGSGSTGTSASPQAK